MAFSIQDQITSIYEASGFRTTAGPSQMLVTATRSAPDGTGSEDIAIALPMEIKPSPSTADILREIANWKPNGRDRIFVVALPKLLSLGAELQTQVRNAGAEVRYYAGLLDGGFGGGYIGLGSGQDSGVEELRARLFNYSRVDADLIAAVVRKQYAVQAQAQAPTRVQQRYFLRDGIELARRRGGAGTDLLHHLVARLGQPNSTPEVYLIVGPGGSGKSFLFQGLFTYLFEAFHNNKQRQQPGVRPIPVMPESLIEAGSRSSDDLFEAVAATEFGARGGLGLLEHLVRDGKNVLLFDGLDEFFADNSDLGATIAERFFTAGSHARIFIILRDSLLETSDNVRALADRFQRELGPDGFNIYELALWDDPQAKRELSWLKLEGRRPEPGEADAPLVAEFLATLAQSPALADLSRLAFYCDLLIDLFVLNREGAVFEDRTGRQMPQNAYELLGLCFDLITDRELEKQRPDTETVPEFAFLKGIHAELTDEDIALNLASAATFGGFNSSNLDILMAAQSGGGDPRLAWGRLGLVGIIEEAAYFARRRPDGGRVTPRALQQLYADANAGADEDYRRLGERMLRQLVLFVQGKNAGSVDFTHEIMADYLAARYAVNRWRREGGDLRSYLGQPVGSETAIFMGYIRHELGH